MTSTFGQPSQASTPISNPFATKPTLPNPFAVSSNSTVNAASTNNGGDSAWPSTKKQTGVDGPAPNGILNGFGGLGAQPRNNDFKKNQQGDNRKDKKGKNRENGGSRQLGAATNGVLANAQKPSTSAGDGFTVNTTDSHAFKVYDQLRKDGISPPNWPSQPGDPNNKAIMAAFREKYEAYRERVRASLMKAGIIDDPSKRKTLSDAIDFKGISEEMCPEYEKITRITELDVHGPEKDVNTGFALNGRMVKKLARSAAGQEAPLPMDVRSVPTLRKTLDYLIDDLLEDDKNLPGLHGFIWDRTRAIRRDFTFFSSLDSEELKTQVYVLENIARFHVTALHLLSQESVRPEDFVEQQELEQLGKALLSLRDLYDDCNDQGLQCENETEFRAYYLIFYGVDPNIIEVVQRQWKPELWKNSDEIRTAVSLVEAMHNTRDFHGVQALKQAPSAIAAGPNHAYFRIVEDPSISYTMACFAEIHFPTIRRSILNALVKALGRPKEPGRDVTAADLNKYLRFDTVEEAIAFAKFHDLDFSPDEEQPSNIERQRVLLSLGKRLAHDRLQHQFSQTLVEKKRGFRKFPEVIHETVFEDENAKGSLFVTEKSTTSWGGSNKSNLLGNKPSGGGFPNGAIATTTQSAIPASGLGNPFQNKLASMIAPASNPFAGASLSHTTGGPQPSVFGTLPTPRNQFDGSPADVSNSTNHKPNPFDNAAPSQAAPSPFTAFQQNAGPASKPSPFAPSQPGALQQNSLVNGIVNHGQSFETPKLSSLSSLSNMNQSTKVSETGSSTAKVASPFASAGPSNAPAFPTSNGPSFDFTKQDGSIAAATQGSNNAGGGSLAESGRQNGQLGGSLLQVPAATSPFPSTNIPGSSTTFSSSLPHPTPTASGLSTAPSILSQADSITTIPASLFAPASLPAKMVAPVKPQDLMGDFTRWFVQGDGGVLEEFRNYMVENIVSKAYDDYVWQERESVQREQDEALAAEAEAWRIYNIQLKFFHRWKRNARAKRQSYLRRSGRDRYRQYYKDLRERELREEQAAAKQRAKQEEDVANLDRPEEFSRMLRNRERNRQRAENALVASGVLDGIDDERGAARRIVSREPTPASDFSYAGSAPADSVSGKKSSKKTEALRAKFFGNKQSSFRKSMPPPSRSATPDTRSRVSARWKLKAMGIVQLSDGTAVPESLANEMSNGGQSFPGWDLGENTSSPLSGRVSLESNVDYRRSLSRSQNLAESVYNNKRKRLTDDDGTTAEDHDRSTSLHKRVMSEGGQQLNDTEQFIADMRALREDLEEGTQWFREQRLRMESENRSRSRSRTPWRDRSIP